MKLRHIEGKTFRYCGYYIEQHVDNVFYAYLCDAGYGSQKVWANVQGSIRGAIGAIQKHMTCAS